MMIFNCENRKNMWLFIFFIFLECTKVEQRKENNRIHSEIINKYNPNKALNLYASTKKKKEI